MVFEIFGKAFALTVLESLMIELNRPALVVDGPIKVYQKSWLGLSTLI